VAEAQAAVALATTVKSPKSIAFPVVAIVTYSIVFLFIPDSAAPPKIPRVADAQPEVNPLGVVNAPKLIEFPVDAIVM
jgi:hypothetical protein